MKQKELLPALSGRWELDLELSRTLTLAAVGLLYSGPINHMWFATLEKLVRLRHQAGSVVLKLLLDQAMFVPAAISGYLTVRGVFEHKSGVEILAQLDEKVATATKAAWQFWPLVNLVSFSVVPVMYRVLFGNVCAVFWNAKLSSISSQGSGTAARSAEQTPTIPAIDKYQIKLALGSFSTNVEQRLAAQAERFRSFLIDKLSDHGLAEMQLYEW